MSQHLPPAITSPMAWSGPAIQDKGDWKIALDQQQKSDLRAGLAQLQTHGLALQNVGRKDFHLRPSLEALRDRILEALKHGLGFAVLQGFPVQGLDDEAIRLMYLGFSKHLGTCISQDPNCAMIADVKEKGLGTGKLTRAYGSKHGTRLHVDLADVVGLLGVRQAPRGALSLLASSTTIYNEFVAQHPEWLPAAMEGFYWDRYGEHKPWEDAISPRKVPLFSIADGQVSARYNRNWITAAAVRREVPFSAQEESILDFFDAMALKHALPIRMAPGDLYIANNYVVLHGRESYEEDETTPFDERRLFLRVWLNVPGLRTFSDESLVRYGLTSHGNIGWTSAELREGKHLEQGSTRIRIEDADAMSA